MSIPYDDPRRKHRAFMRGFRWGAVIGILQVCAFVVPSFVEAFRLYGREDFADRFESQLGYTITFTMMAAVMMGVVIGMVCTAWVRWVFPESRLGD